MVRVWMWHNPILLSTRGGDTTLNTVSSTHAELTYAVPASNVQHCFVPDKMTLET